MRQRTLFLLLDVVVAALLVGGEEGEGDHRAAGGKLGVAPGRRRRAEPERDRQSAGVGHLRGERALPDQVVEGELVAVQLPLELLRVRNESPAGWIASWASCAFFTLRAYWRGASGIESGP